MAKMNLNFIVSAWRGLDAESTRNKCSKFFPGSIAVKDYQEPDHELHCDSVLDFFRSVDKFRHLPKGCQGSVNNKAWEETVR